MNALWWIISGVVLLVLASSRRVRPDRERLPGDFNFDAYKTREIVQRGVFDKTKWR
ncbi:hypothetical protein [Solidesulfovibrio aerotolerans]|uniref:hypothetical protein n=1 Tax=Solidesulfovibrio aerotolerans TaxID=295255 RepID=UPI001478A384|nr:hypothetical protein [Solidesulfovibrio aerotolerans]